MSVCLSGRHHSGYSGWCGRRLDVWIHSPCRHSLVQEVRRLFFTYLQFSVSRGSDQNTDRKVSVLECGLIACSKPQSYQTSVFRNKAFKIKDLRLKLAIIIRCMQLNQWWCRYCRCNTTISYGIRETLTSCHESHAVVFCHKTRKHVSWDIILLWDARRHVARLKFYGGGRQANFRGCKNSVD